ncbi:hypothetical protein FHS02_002927 [Massilia umbonata]|uniref:IS256 family transposase n=1 Tax=Pseudoduganella umbonata TaxID=864828 RepID=A0A7W5EBI5_9BURK|nr:hypothetical protein [Pseudoduganella umbonata]
MRDAGTASAARAGAAIRHSTTLLQLQSRNRSVGSRTILDRFPARPDTSRPAWREAEQTSSAFFPNDAAIVRLVGAMMLEQDDEWSLQRRYMQLEGLLSLSDNQPARLSAVIN